MKKADREKMLEYIDRITDGYVYCFSSEWTNTYMQHWLEMKWHSALYNNEIGRLNLEVLKKQEIEDTSDLEPEDSKVKEVRDFYMREMKKAFKEKLPKHFEQLDNQKKKEKQAESEAKDKK